MVKNNKGETLVETLVALLIITIVITGFSGVIASVIKTNKAIREMRITYDYNADVPIDTNHNWSITIDGRAYDLTNVGTYENNELFYYDYEG